MAVRIWSWLARFLMGQIKILERYAWQKTIDANMVEAQAIIRDNLTTIDRTRTQIIPALSEQTIMEDWSERTIMEDWTNKFPQ